jgi:hypothetical protein
MVWMSCKTSVSSKCGPCPLYPQIAPYVAVKIVDKTTGADLFLSPNSPYKFSDLKVSSSISGTDVSVIEDSTQTGNRFAKIWATSTQTFTLKLASLSADSIRVVIKTDSPKCCPVIKVSSITLNTTLICAPCTYSEAVTIKK